MRGGRVPAGGTPVLQMPDMNRGSCAEQVNIELFQRAQEEDRRTLTMVARVEAALICTQRCPMCLDCRDYVLIAETAAGQWPGVWGGMDSDERRRIRRAQH